MTPNIGRESDAGSPNAHIGEVRYAVTIKVGRHEILADQPEFLGG